MKATGSERSILGSRTSLAGVRAIRRSRTASRADADGVARLRVPYASRESHEAFATGAWTVSVGDRSVEVEVDEAAVRGGGEVPVAP